MLPSLWEVGEGAVRLVPELIFFTSSRRAATCRRNVSWLTMIRAARTFVFVVPPTHPWCTALPRGNDGPDGRLPLILEAATSCRFRADASEPSAMAL